MKSFFLNTNTKLPLDVGGQPLENVEEKEFILKSPSTSAKGSELCVEDSYIIQKKVDISDDVRSSCF
jgi:hypothetical protein